MSKPSSASAAGVDVLIHSLVEIEIRPGCARRFPAGWTGRVPASLADKIEARSAGARVAKKAAGRSKTQGDD